MLRTSLFLKIELEHDEIENAEKLGEEICRRISKIYGVRSAEVSSLITTGQ